MHTGAWPGRVGGWDARPVESGWQMSPAPTEFEPHLHSPLWSGSARNRYASEGHRKSTYRFGHHGEFLLVARRRAWRRAWPFRCLVVLRLVGHHGGVGRAGRHEPQDPALVLEAVGFARATLANCRTSSAMVSSSSTDSGPSGRANAPHRGGDGRLQGLVGVGEQGLCPAPSQPAGPQEVSPSGAVLWSRPTKSSTWSDAGAAKGRDCPTPSSRRRARSAAPGHRGQVVVRTRDGSAGMHEAADGRRVVKLSPACISRPAGDAVAIGVETMPVPCMNPKSAETVRPEPLAAVSDSRRKSPRHALTEIAVGVIAAVAAFGDRNPGGPVLGGHGGRPRYSLREREDVRSGRRPAPPRRGLGTGHDLIQGPPGSDRGDESED